MPAPGDLYDACAEAAAAGPRWRHGPPVLWLTAPYVQVAGRTWRARASRPSAGDASMTVHGYSARQCGQIASALLPVMAASAAEAERHAAAILGLAGT